MSFPQLRLRTGFSYREAYGRTPDVIARLKAIGCTSGAIVDQGTWGHVKFEQSMEKAELSPMFGMEIPIKSMREDGEESKFKPRAWVLAEDTKQFYQLTSKSVQGAGLFAADIANARGVIRFAGGAFRELCINEYDYLDVNPASNLDAYAKVRIHRKYGVPLVITNLNDMPRAEDQSHANSWEVKDSVGIKHIADETELWSMLRYSMSRAEFDSGIRNAHDIAERLKSVRLQKAPMIHLEGDIVALCRDGQKYRIDNGHIEKWTNEYEDRLIEEIKQIQAKDFDSYFLVVSDLVRYAKTKMLVGPARGSSAGSLVCYLMGITEVDPLPHSLLFQRFIDISRSDLPDIDIDFSDTKRHLVFEYLQQKYGAANCARLGSVNTLKAASVMAQVGKKFGIPAQETFQVKSALIEYSSGDARYGSALKDTFAETAPGKDFRETYPDAADCMGAIELHPSHSGVHAAGILVCNDAVSQYCTVNHEGVAQIDKKDTEHLNLLKIDALGLRTLGIIEDSGVTSAEELYGLKLDDPAVFAVLNEDRMSGIFQFEGRAVRSVTSLVNIDRFSKIDNLTALARPGPLSSGMAYTFADRSSGKEPVTFAFPELEKYLKDTYGVFLYQEQIMFVVKEIGLFDWVKTSAIRKAMSGSKGEEYFNVMGADFIAGAVSQGIAEDKASKIWKEMVTFGSWGFNKSHSVSYAIVTYWTCWLKAYHKLPFAAACLRAAKDDDQTIAILRELAKEGVQYTPIDPEFSEMNWTVADGRLIGGIMNAKGYGPVKALRYCQKREAGTLTQKDKDALAKAETQFADLCEAHTRWGHFYDDPTLAGVTSGKPIIGMREGVDTTDARNPTSFLVIGKMVKKVLADENEAIRIKKRGGKRYKGKLTQFITITMVDDSTDTPFQFRIRPDLYPTLGVMVAECPLGAWFLVRGWKISGLDMVMVKNIRRLDV